MRTYKLTVVYDGSRYQGWQRQTSTERTIQGILERAVSEVTGRETEINGSGRTDGGVHAKGQTASMVLPGKVEETGFCASLNEALPEDIRVKEMTLVKNGFHARFNAKGKRYEYFIDTREKPDVFTRKYCFHYPHELNISAMEEAAGYLIGTDVYKRQPQTGAAYGYRIGGTLMSPVGVHKQGDTVPVSK